MSSSRWRTSPTSGSSAPHGPLLARCWELRNNLTVYDAAYIALAELLTTTLVTGDTRLAEVPGTRCEVEVL